VKNENEFNAYISKQLRLIRNEAKIAFLKTSEKFAVGVSDFLVFKDGHAACLECKFIKELPDRSGTQVLRHPFGGAQLKFFDDMQIGAVPAWGVVGVKEYDVIVLVDRLVVGKGNWVKRDFMDIINWNIPGACVFDIKDVALLVTYATGSRHEPVTYKPETRKDGIKVMKRTLA